MQPVKQITLNDGAELAPYLQALQQPLLIKGLVAHWPAVQKGQVSTDCLLKYLSEKASAQPLGIGNLPASAESRLFYNQDFSGFNFIRQSGDFSALSQYLQQAAKVNDGTAWYMGSTATKSLFPGFVEENNLPLAIQDTAKVSAWFSNKIRIAAHQDLPDNLACCVHGKREFTLFPPDQLENLYIGPLDLTPAGQPISLVDVKHPDLTRFPRYKEALKQAQQVILEPGDALLIPALWWHAVDSLDAVNMLVNYWWQSSEDFAGPPVDVLLHGLLNLNSLSSQQKQAIKHWFDYYLFNEDPQRLAHIPTQAKGILDPHSAMAARKLRAALLNSLNR